MLRRMRWMSDGDGRWELDAETPVTMEGTARPVPGDPLPLGLSRGPRVTRPKQLDFFHRFMASPLVPSFSASGEGLSVHHAHLLHLAHNWSCTILEQIHVPKLVSVLPHQNLTFQASWPGLFVDKEGAYWDVPLSLSADLASVGSSSGLSYHLLLQQNSGEPKCFGGDGTSDVPIALLPGLCAKAAISIKKSIDVWRRKEDKLKNVQPYDVFLSDSHVSFTGIVVGPNAYHFDFLLFYSGAVASGYLGDCSKTQYGNFQRLFLDLTRASARFDISSGSLFLCGASRLAQDFFFSRRPEIETFCDVCPDVVVSLQQQIIGPFSFRVESSVTIDPRRQDHYVRVDDSVFAIDWALKVLGSAKATAWYSPKHQEAMVELRFFEA
ncbi:hypothetical protein PR202_ga23847 [Eleusine coracana subsp. coracana]|uniref:Protein TRIGALACTOSYLDIACYLGLYCEROL 4, chloroplastic n=1 Tax=Eleusine coracana subsp. coracana TaxID=191504 RepID=A0AAV5D7N9_ELECO|nr:hypothetical protein PR202_ga23847 [Eleusine coracana subsp. coracana]